MTNIDNFVDAGLHEAARTLMVKALVDNAHDLTLTEVETFLKSSKWKDAASSITLADVILAITSGSVKPPKASGKKKEAPKPAAAKKAPKATKKKAKKATKKKAAAKPKTKAEAKPKKPKAKKPKAPKAKKSKAKKVADDATDAGGVSLRTDEGRQAFTDTLVNLLETAQGPLSSTVLIEKSGGSANQVRDVVGKLVKDGKVKFSGKARYTRYFLPKFAAEAEAQAKGRDSGKAAA